MTTVLSRAGRGAPGEARPTLVQEKGASDSEKDVTEVTAGYASSISSIPTLGVPLDEKRFFFQRARAYDPDAIATQVGDSFCH